MMMIISQESIPHEHLTALTAVWGQLVWHDIAYTLPISGYVECCAAMTRQASVKPDDVLTILRRSFSYLSFFSIIYIRLYSFFFSY
jgi:hypothetical protein